MNCQEDDTVQKLKKAVQVDPHDVEAHNRLGLVYHGKGLLDDALREYKEALSIKPDDAWAHYNLGVGYHRKGLLDDAVREYKDVLRIKPDDADALLNLALALEERDKLVALEQWKRYLEVAQNDPRQQGGITEARERIRKLGGSDCSYRFLEAFYSPYLKGGAKDVGIARCPEVWRWTTRGTETTLRRRERTCGSE